MKFKLELKWQTACIGVVHKKKFRMEVSDVVSTFPLNYKLIHISEQHIWICIIPCLPIHIWWVIDPKEGRRGVIA